MVSRESRKPLILGCSLGNCVHVAGALSFLEQAREHGYETEFLGAAVGVAELVAAAKERRPEIVAVSYRLTPEVAANLFERLREELARAGLQGQRLVLGGTPPVGRVGRESGLFEGIFTGVEPPEEVRAYLRGAKLEPSPEGYGRTLIERIANKAPVPILRHHFGQPTVAATVAGARQIAEAEVLDVLSLGPDQNAQASFFRPEEIDPALDGAGGVPVRTPEDLRAIYEASRCGNFPLVRIYSGTRDLVRWAEVAVETIDNAWGAIPLCWYNTLDRRSDRSPEQSIAENLECMRWYAEHGRPVECNEPHHWSMRDAPDAVACASAFLGAYNAKAVGVRHYVAQYMFGCPGRVSPQMDLAKMLAQIDLVEELEDERFSTLRQTRAGLLSFAADPDVAKGQLAAATVTQMALAPEIVHVVGYSEGDHAARAEEVIESCRIVSGAVRNSLLGLPDATQDPRVQERREELVAETRLTLEAVRSLAQADEDGWASPRCLARAIKLGVLDAPHLQGNADAAGTVMTGIVDGAVRPLDPETCQPISEAERLKRLELG